MSVKLLQIPFKFMVTLLFLQTHESIDQIEILFSNIIIMYINTKIISLPKLYPAHRYANTLRHTHIQKRERTHTDMFIFQMN